jgi:integrase
VADLVTPPRVERIDMQVLSPEQSRRLLEEATGDRLEALYVLALTTGMRQGEILALHWRDIDLDRRTVNVHLTVHRVRDTFLFTEPKTPSSRRQIVLTEAATSALRRHRAAQVEERLRTGDRLEDADLVFTNHEGRPIDASNLLRHCFHPLLSRAGLPKVRFHDLHHTAATLLLGQGVHAKIVSEMLGHSNIAITMDLYSHVTPTMQREAARALDSLLSP